MIDLETLRGDGFEVWTCPECGGHEIITFQRGYLLSNRCATCGEANDPERLAHALVRSLRQAGEWGGTFKSDGPVERTLRWEVSVRWIDTLNELPAVERLTLPSGDYWRYVFRSGHGMSRRVVHIGMRTSDGWFAPMCHTPIELDTATREPPHQRVCQICTWMFDNHGH